ncbi:iron-sulfur cluster co-chaperone HscB C-terminal domain-containing protein [Segetibacter sp.]|jgi:molecular chaperone HscB|uniref:iron-sulfur cluster co-chaperone HscB C-terminal domain-containing protein n=1 Tax=Segetibacter sp. TaxID=2231182 RepID=UPI002611ABBB|nr:iron-sulfur cluster co-chaperone HscB C-terminal domain-containing protein [Segetibacter sp.]MCW3080799.1 chaperone protein HscB [Segetibacter sp.]
MNHFELFKIPITLTPNMGQLKPKFYELSRKFHPDFFTNETEGEQSEALEVSSQINKAFKVFQNKDETIKYVLQLKGLLEEEEKYNLQPDFLMEMMDLNEQMMEATMQGDEEATGKLKTTVAEAEAEIYEPVKEIIEEYEEGKTTTEELLRVKEYYYKKKYLNRILATMQR